jgi:hypothetical protein
MATVMDAFTAIILVYQSSLRICATSSAVEVRSTRVANEIGCVTGWQEIMARADAAAEIGRTTYTSRRSAAARRPPNGIDDGSDYRCGCASASGRPAAAHPSVPSGYQWTRM